LPGIILETTNDFLSSTAVHLSTLQRSAEEQVRGFGLSALPRAFYEFDIELPWGKSFRVVGLSRRGLDGSV
jgi:hypothetical protein